MKAILKSIRPQHVSNILNGDKIIEIDKSAPKEWKDYLSGKTDKKPEPREVYIYCTKLVPYGYGCMFDELSKKYETTFCNDGKDLPNLTGKVVAKFTLNKVEEIYWKQDLSNPYVSDNYNLETDTLKEWELRNKSCLESEELEDYLGFDDSEFKALGYAWHIDNLVIFDKPKEISEFLCFGKSLNYKGIKTYPNFHRLTKAPQSWCYVEELL